MFSKEPPPFNWIYDINKVREVFLSIFEDPELHEDTFDSQLLNSTFVLDGGDIKEL